ncbi:MAG: lysophospholipid acyltransferase family protein [Planctomycetaceae bacterium]
MAPPSSSPLADPIQPNWVWRFIRLVLRNVFGFWLQYRARGLEQLPERGALLLINHQSFLDPMLVGLPLQRPVSYLARDTLFPIPLIGWVLRNAYVMPIRRDAATTESLRESIRRVDHGFYVGVFPEGTRSRDGEIGPFKPGFVALLRRCQAPLIPVGIAGAHEAMPRGKILLRPRPVRVVFGAAIPHAVLAPLLVKGREQELLDLTQQQVAACHEQAEAWRCEAG